MNITKIQQRIDSKFSGLKFDPESHTYTLNGTELESTSTYIKQFVKEFEGYIIAQAMSKSFNKKNPNLSHRDNKYYLRRWKDISNAALATGTKVHNYVENNYPHFTDKPDCKKEEGVVQFFLDLDPKYVVVKLELRMFMEDIRRSGTTDLLLYNKETRKFIIADWKTNEKDLFSCYKGQKLLDPFSEYYSNDYNKYSLQLSDYKNMFEIMCNGFEVEELWIIHLTNTAFKDKDNYIREKVKPIKKHKYYKIYNARDFSKELKNKYHERELEYHWYN